MDNNIVFLITTYNRPKSLSKLVKSIASHGDIYILNDDITDININGNYLQGHKIFIGTKIHGGKKGYWKTVNDLFAMVPKKYDYYFMIPDDFLPVADFVNKAIGTWDKIRNNRKICMNTYVSLGRLGRANWTGFKPIEYRYYRKTQWVDMCFLCTGDFFDAIGRIPNLKLNWDDRPELSSGVGSHISCKLIRMGYDIYQAKRSLFEPQREAHKSQMNPWRKKDDTLNKAVL